VYANRALAAITGQPVDEHIGKSQLPFARPSQGTNGTGRQFVAHHGIQRLDTQFVSSGGNAIAIRVCESPIEYNGSTCVLGTVLDITMHKQGVAELKDRLAFEQLLADFSAAFINVPSAEIDPLIGTCLK